jgi:hypothetical protein
VDRRKIIHEKTLKRKFRGTVRLRYCTTDWWFGGTGGWGGVKSWFIRFVLKVGSFLNDHCKRTLSKDDKKQFYAA